MPSLICSMLAVRIWPSHCAVLQLRRAAAKKSNTISCDFYLSQNKGSLQKKLMFTTHIHEINKKNKQEKQPSNLPCGHVDVVFLAPQVHGGDTAYSGWACFTRAASGASGRACRRAERGERGSRRAGPRSFKGGGRGWGGFSTGRISQGSAPVDINHGVPVTQSLLGLDSTFSVNNNDTPATAITDDHNFKFSFFLELAIGILVKC